MADFETGSRSRNAATVVYPDRFVFPVLIVASLTYLDSLVICL